MIADLKPYPTYKDTGVEWLGQVPSGWEVRRQSNLMELRISNVDKHRVHGERPVRLCNYVDVYRRDRIRADIPFSSGTALGSEIERFRLRRGDVLITKDSESWEDIARPALVEHDADDLVCGYHLAILRPRPELSGDYLFWVSQSVPVASQYQVSANGVTRFGLTQGDIKGVEIPLPPLEDQTAIARFLDHIDLRIQRSIAAQERLIALLREEEQAIVYRAAVRGLDSSVPFKSSGVNWLGDVPAHWEMVPLQRITKSRCDGPFGSGLTSAHYVDQGVRVVRLQNISPGRFADGNPAFISEEHYATLGDHDVVAGDLLVAGLGDDKRHVGRACVAPKGIEPAMVKADCFRFRLRAEQPEFVARQLSATARLTVGFARGSTRQRMNLGAMGARPVALPPRDEQLAVTRYLDDVEDRIGRATSAAERQIVSVREYRTRLIADVVSGKLDIREAAENLPENPEAVDPALDERLEEVAAT